jgi:putative ABC transport system permease protein
VQGVPVKTVVASLREVEWRRLQPNFFVVFPLGVLEEAPSFHVLVTRVGSSATSATLQRALVQKFPNVSVIDLTLVLQTIDSILNKIAFVLRFMAVFTVGTGLLVLVASILSGRFQRLQESVLLRTLGASRSQVLQVLFVEYAALGTLAALTGIVLAAVGSWALARFVFHINYSVSAGPLVAAVGIVSTLTVTTGLLTSRGVCAQPPLEVLRGEV